MNLERKGKRARLICMYMYMCTYNMTIRLAFEFAHMGFIFVCIYLGIALQSEHV